MTHTALTADEEIRRIRGIATARNESRMGGDGHHDSSAHRGPVEDPTYRDLVTFARTWPMCVMRARARLSTVIHRLGRRSGGTITGPVVTATGSSVAKKAQSRLAKCPALVSPQRPG
jgi:hypothetical protein